LGSSAQLLVVKFIYRIEQEIYGDFLPKGKKNSISDLYNRLPEFEEYKLDSGNVFTIRRPTLGDCKLISNKAKLYQEKLSDNSYAFLAWQLSEFLVAINGDPVEETWGESEYIDFITDILNPTDAHGLTSAFLELQGVSKERQEQLLSDFKLTPPK